MKKAFTLIEFIIVACFIILVSSIVVFVKNPPKNKPQPQPFIQVLEEQEVSSSMISFNDRTFFRKVKDLQTDKIYLQVITVNHSTLSEIKE
jgi:competence protein ComGC